MHRFQLPDGIKVGRGFGQQGASCLAACCHLQAHSSAPCAWQQLTSYQHRTAAIDYGGKHGCCSHVATAAHAVLAFADVLLGLWLAAAASRPPSMTAGPRCADGPQRCIRALPGALPLSACDRLAPRAQPACASAALPAAGFKPCGLPAETACTARPGWLPPAPMTSAHATSRRRRSTPAVLVQRGALLHKRKGIARSSQPSRHLLEDDASLHASELAERRLLAQALTLV